MGSAGPAFGVSSIPHIIFIDEHGNKVDEQVGSFPDLASFEAKLKQII